MALQLNSSFIDDQYLINTLEVMTRSPLHQLAQAEISIAECRQQMWNISEQLLEYLYELTPDDELLPYSQLLCSLREKCLQLIENANLHESGTCSLLAPKITIKDAQEFEFKPWCESDLDFYHEYLDDPSLWNNLIDMYRGPISKEKALYLLHNSNSMPEYHRVYAIHHKRIPIGQMRIVFETPTRVASQTTGEISCWLGREYCGQGIMTKAFPLFTQKLFQDFNLESIYGLALNSNIASQKLLVSSGYFLEIDHFRNVIKEGRKLHLKMYRTFASTYTQSV